MRRGDRRTLVLADLDALDGRLLDVLDRLAGALDPVAP
jgi:hypothetical protein